MASSLPTPPAQNKPKLLDQVRERMRLRHYSIRTEEAVRLEETERRMAGDLSHEHKRGTSRRINSRQQFGCGQRHRRLRLSGLLAGPREWRVMAL
jgi:hypothetical protein